MSVEYAIVTVNGFRTPCNDSSDLRAPQWPQMFDQTDVVSVDIGLDQTDMGVQNVQA
jgi:hypothetical protein